MRRTSDLIDSLVADARPVKRLRAPVLRAAGWLLFAALILALIAIARGARPDLAHKLGEPLFAAGVTAAMLTGALAAVAAFIASVPGRSRRWLLLPVPALAAWMATIGYGCLTDWVRIGPEGISAGESLRCVATLALAGTPLSLVMLVMLRHVACLAPAPVAMTASLAVAALTAAALSMFHPIDASAMILIWNAGPAALFCVAGALCGPRLLGTIAPR